MLINSCAHCTNFWKFVIFYTNLSMKQFTKNNIISILNSIFFNSVSFNSLATKTEIGF